MNANSAHATVAVAKACTVERKPMNKIAMLTEILTLNPGDAFARYGLAMEYANQGQTDPSLAEFDRLLSTHPDYTPKTRLDQGIASARRTGNQHALNEMQALLLELE
jgi:cytochrome c-type biogenesis protein CcmH/NrfG